MRQKFETERPHAEHGECHKSRGTAEGYNPVGDCEIEQRFVDAAQATHDQRFGLAHTLRQ